MRNQNQTIQVSTIQKQDSIKDIFINNTGLVQGDSILPVKVNKVIDKYMSEKTLCMLATDCLVKNYGWRWDSSIDESIKIKYYKEIEVYNLNKISIFSINFDHDVCAHSKAVLLADNINNNMYILDLDTIIPFSISEDKESYYFAGIYIDRYNYGTFEIYNFKNGILYNILALDECAFNYSFECISYEKKYLDIQNIKINEDSFLDLRFSGVRNHYCHGFQTNGRRNVPPIKKDTITINCIYDPNIKSWRQKVKISSPIILD